MFFHTPISRVPTHVPSFILDLLFLAPCHYQLFLIFVRLYLIATSLHNEYFIWLKIGLFRFKIWNMYISMDKIWLLKHINKLWSDYSQHCDPVSVLTITSLIQVFASQGWLVGRAKKYSIHWKAAILVRGGGPACELSPFWQQSAKSWFICGTDTV